MKRVILLLSALLAVCALGYYFPLFHVVSRHAIQAEHEQRAFHAASYAKDFWANRLTPAFASAADAAVVLAALQDDPASARLEFGRVAGLSRTSLFLIRGSGTVVLVQADQIGISLNGTNGKADIQLLTGLLFGNSVRDATGLVQGDDFANSQQFNELSTELNRIVENTILPPIVARAKVGDSLDFVGCSEVTNLPRDIEPLKVIPLQVRFK